MVALDRAQSSVRRRVVWASRWREWVDGELYPRAPDLVTSLGKLPYVAGQTVFDAVESVRGIGVVPDFGRVHMSAMRSAGRLPQPPGYLGYSYDPSRHALVGMLVGLDLIKQGERYWAVEANLGASLRIDDDEYYARSVLQSLARTAREAGFRKIVIVRRDAFPALAELVAELSGDEVELTIATRKTRGRARPPVPRLPDPLERETLYVLHAGQGTPLSFFVHDKLCSSGWLCPCGEGASTRFRHLRAPPTFNELVVADEPRDERWPNLVVKLADRDGGTAIAMGRFRDPDHARRSLRMDKHGMPRVLPSTRLQRAVNPFLGILRPLYQPFIVPDVVDGRIGRTRLLAFVSPLLDRFLHAHARLSADPLPMKPIDGLVDARTYSMSSRSVGPRLPIDLGTQEILRLVAAEYGLLAREAIERRFETGPAQG